MTAIRRRERIKYDFIFLARIQLCVGRQSETDEGTDAARRRRVGLKELCGAVEPEGWRPGAYGHADGCAGSADSGNAGGLPIGQGNDLYGSGALQALLERRCGGFYRHLIEAGRGPGCGEEADRADDGGFGTRICLYQRGIQRLDWIAGGPVFSAELHAAGCGDAGCSGGDCEHADDFRLRSGGANLELSGRLAGIARRFGRWCCWRRLRFRLWA